MVMHNEVNEFSEPELYDAFNDDCINDILWYLEYCKNHACILELGAGTGRIAVPLAQSGHEVWGVDNSIDMLRLLRKKAKALSLSGIHIVNQDMCSLKMDRTFDIAIIPFCTFNFLLTVEEQKAALLSLKRCLLPGAVVVFELMTLCTFSLQDKLPEFVYYRTVNTDLGNMDIYLKNSFDDRSKILKQNRLFKIYDNDSHVKEKNLVMKNVIISLEEFKRLSTDCGYEIQNVYGDFDNTPLNDNSHSLIVIARRR